MRFFLTFLAFILFASNGMSQDDCPAGFYSVSGKITSWCDKPIDGAIGSINSAQPEFPINTDVSIDGEYIQCLASFPGVSYEIQFYNESNYLDGVSYLDYELIKRHIDNVEIFTNVYQKIAADINGDGSINSADLIELEKLLSGVYSELPSNTSWRFFYTSSNTQLNEIYTLYWLDQNTVVDWVAVKIGDVNCQTDEFYWNFIGDALCSIVELGECPESFFKTQKEQVPQVNTANKYSLTCYAEVTMSDDPSSIVFLAEMFLALDTYESSENYSITITPNIGSGLSQFVATEGTPYDFTNALGSHVYQVTDSSGTSCWGNFIINDNSNNEDFSYTELYTFCLGDSVLLLNSVQNDFPEFLGTIASFEEEFPFMANVTELGNNLYDIEWNQEGKSCLCFNYTFLDWQSGEESKVRQCRGVEVLPRSQLGIIDDNGNLNNSTICKGEQITFQQAGMILSNVEWQVSNGEVYNTSEVGLTFDSPGVYTVMLSDSGDCNCNAPATFVITVLDGEIPAIACLGTVCEGDTAIYYAEMLCESYIWSVSSEGTILEGGGPMDAYISVEWLSGVAGTVTLETPDCIEDACNTTVTETIPIISNTNVISGPIEVCFGDLSVYTLPLMQGVEYDWVLNQNGIIVDGQGSNTIAVHWNDWGSPTALVSVNYESCTAGCNGYAELTIDLKPRFNVKVGDIEQCVGSIVTCSNTRYLDLDYTLTFPDGRDSMILGVRDFSFKANEAGNYLLIGENLAGTTCNIEDDIQFSIVAPPTVPSSGIIGPNTICKGVPAEYSIAVGQDIQVNWSFSDGALGFFTATGNPVYFIWQSDGPYTIEVQLTTMGLGCQSDLESFALSNNVEINGDDKLCVNTTSDYILESDASSSISWNILPENSGHIIDATDNLVTIFWQQPGIHQLIGNICDVDVVHTVLVMPPPNYSVTYPDSICFGEMATIDIVTDTDNYFSVSDEDENFLSAVNPTSVGPGIFKIIVSNSTGCIDSNRIKIVERDSFGINIFSSDDLTFCLPHPNVALLSEDIQGSYTYQWYRDNIAITGETNSKLFTNIYGNYHLVITDTSGCQAISNVLRIIETCGGSGTGGGNTVFVVINPMNIDGDDIDNFPECNNYSFEIDPPFVSTSFNWNFDDPDSGADNTATGLNPTHEFTRAGYYNVRASGNLNNEIARIQITIPVVPDFKSIVTCPYNPVVFTDNSSLLPDLSGLIYIWDFGDPASGIDNTSSLVNPQHLFSSAGVFDVTLSITDLSGCVSHITKQIEIIDYADSNILVDTVNCQGNSLALSIDLVEVDFEYLWDFDDPASGTANASDLLNPYHTYQTPGLYVVTLTMSDIDGCLYVITQEINISSNTLIGDITINPAAPKCPEEDAILTAPAPGNFYLWSTGETTQDIAVNEPGIYGVTITNANDCVYVPNPISVANHEIEKLKICGTVYRDGSFPIKSCESLELCFGQEFELECDQLSGATYTWTSGQIGRVLDYSYLSTLGPGQYSFGVTVDYPLLGCVHVVDPFEVKINPLPSVPTILNQSTDFCEGGIKIISVENPEVGVTYQWSTGEEGESLSVINNGDYWVESINSSGCRQRSNVVTINPNPRSPAWLTGCLEVCFPQQYCVNLDPANSYMLYNFGMPTQALDVTQDFVDILTPGDYQLEVTNPFGCTDMTDILSLTAIPNQQTVNGTVYLDENDNGVFDGVDSYMEDIKVLLVLGNTLIDCETTDVNGAYDFGQVSYSNLEVVIDTIGLLTTYTGNMDSLLVYDNCIEDKEIHFPLVQDCDRVEQEINLEVCPGLTVNFDGNTYGENELDTIRMLTTAGCDSLVYVSVVPYEEVTLDYSLSPTCAINDIGQFVFESTSESSLIYNLDGVVIDSLSLSQIQLEEGSHQLIVMTSNGCTQTIDFVIDALPEPDLLLNLSQSCASANEGSLTIDNLNAMELTTGLDPSFMVLDETAYSNLDTGDYVLYVSDSLGCLYEYPFKIEPFQMPEVDVYSTATCVNETGGILNVEIVSGNPMFAIDQSDSFDSNLEYQGLTSGQHILYLMSEDGCMDSLEFAIEILPEPHLEIETLTTCQDIETGSLIINTLGTDLSYSLDGISYQVDPYFNDLASDTYILYVSTQEGCNIEMPFSIEPTAEPELILNTENSCNGELVGELSIDIQSGSGLSFSLDPNATPQVDPYFGGLGSGLYNLLIWDDLGCEYTLPFMIEEFDDPLYEFAIENACYTDEGGVFEIIGSIGNPQFAVDDQDYSNDLYFPNLTTGQHILYILSVDGCEYEQPFMVEEFDAPLYEFTIKNTCDAAEGGIFEIIGFNGNPQFAIDNQDYGNDLYFPNLSSGQHTLYVLSEYGCEYERPFIIEIYEDPIVEINTTATCSSEGSGSVTVDVILGNPSFGLDQDASFDIVTTYDDLPIGNHMLYILSQLGCLDSLAFVIDELPQPVLDVIVLSSCVNQATGQIVIDNFIDFESVSFDSEVVADPGILNDLSPGTYTLVGTDSNGCTSVIDVDVTSLEELDVRWPEVLIECSTAQVLLDPEIVSQTGPVSYLWSNGSTSSQITISSGDEYSVTIKDYCETVTQEWDVEFPVLIDDRSIFTPNIFMPKVSGVNSCFAVGIPSDIDLVSFYLSIYDRWGTLMYETENSEDCWNGMFDNQYSEEGVYVFVTNITYLECGQLKGLDRVSDVTLIY